MYITDKIETVLASAFCKCGYKGRFTEVNKCKMPELGDYAAVGALACAKEYHENPREVAAKIAEILKTNEIFSSIRVDGPGFINLKLHDNFIVEAVNKICAADFFSSCHKKKEGKIVLDYGGANIAKPLHVGHLRSAIIGEALKRIARFNGYDAIGDVHLGDWGLQMGMLLHELSLLHPNWPYFDKNKDSDFPKTSPITVNDLEELYPLASKKSKEDQEYLAASRQATFELQQGRSGYVALWQHIVDTSIADLKQDYDALAVTFDLWLGESDANKYIPELIARFQKDGFIRQSEGALIIDVALKTDKNPMPPVIIQKSDGAILYHTTDIATIYQRVKDFNPEFIWYIVDKRQSLHFEQVFRCAYKTHVAADNLKLEHIQFGTMNGKDGKPFKTRSGGVLKLKDLINMVYAKARERLLAGGYAENLTSAEQENAALCIGMAALKFGDLSNLCAKDYVFDIDKFLDFEGKTGPYLLYSAVRARSILQKANVDINQLEKNIVVAQNIAERNLQIALIEFSAVTAEAFLKREPKVLCDYGYLIANLFAQFYAQVKIITEAHLARRAALLSLVYAFCIIIEKVLELLGISAPAKM